MIKPFLLNLKISGIKNIEKAIEIPFYRKTIKNNFEPDQYRVKGIYGENGSGKTAIMTAVKILTRVLLDRNYLTDSVNQKILAECINKKTREGFIEVQFYSDALEVGPFIYRYKIEFAVDKEDRVYIKSESFGRKIGHNSQALFRSVYETKMGSLKSFGDNKDSEYFNYCKEKSQNLLDLKTFAVVMNDVGEYIHTSSRIELQHIFTLMIFASSIYVEIDGEDDHRNYAYNILQEDKQSEVLRENESLTIYNWATTKKKNDDGVLIPKGMFVYYEKEIERLTSFIQIFKTDLKTIRIDQKKYGEYIVCRLVMVYDGYELDEEYESKGIRKLIHLFDVLDAACRGSIVFIDELDSSINDVYLDKLIEYFMYYGKGQLCFTAHNLSPMSVLREGSCAISFISSVNTVHTWTNNGNQNPANAYRDGFIEDSPFNVEASDFLGILGGIDE